MSAGDTVVGYVRGSRGAGTGVSRARMFAPEKRLARQGDSAEERYLRPVPHLSDSTVQCDAEAVIIEPVSYTHLTLPTTPYV